MPGTKNNQEKKRIDSESDDRDPNYRVDLSNLIQFANSELIDDVRRVTNSIESIEREHERGWKSLNGEELIELLKRITSSVEHIETQTQGWQENRVEQLISFMGRITNSIEVMRKDHAQGWKDQRKDLAEIVKRLDKIM